MKIKLTKGLDIPLAGNPEQTIDRANAVDTVALLGADYIGLKPGVAVREGDRVRLGQTLFTDKRNPGVCFTSPGSGIVKAIRRGERRVLLSIVVQLDGDDEETFAGWSPKQLATLPNENVRENLLASGLWTALRTRPYSKIPAPDSVASAIFVTAMDSNPLAADPAVIIAADQEAFAQGVQLLTALTEGKVYLCTAPGANIQAPDGESIEHVQFGGPHPAGLPGTHIHRLHPVSERRSVWHVGYQDVIAIGKLFLTGRLAVDRVVALGGPQVRRPRLLQTRLGANTSDLVANEVSGNTIRVVSGSVLSGHRAADWASYLGRYHTQIAVLQEGSPREFFGWMRPGVDKYSMTRAYAGHLLNHGQFPLTTALNGSPRAMVSIGSFESVMPLDILPTPLLKALLVGDTDSARDLGCLELDEEDLALCSFVCNGKYEYGPHLRRALEQIEVNG